MVNSEYNSLYIRTEGQWSPLADMPNSLITNEFELYSGSNEVLFLAENAMTNNLQWNSLSLKNYSNSYSNWYSFEIDQVKPENEITLVVDANHTLHIVVRQEDSPDLFSLRAYKDVDSDHIFDAIDDLPNTQINGKIRIMMAMVKTSMDRNQMIVQTFRGHLSI